MNIINCEKCGLILTEIDSLCKATFQFLDRPNIASIQKYEYNPDRINSYVS